MSDTPQTPLMVGHGESIIVIRMTGRITSKEGSCFRDVLDQSIGEKGTLVVLDMAACTGIDSTTLGIIASKTQEHFKRVGEHLTVINTPDKLSESLHEFGLGNYLQLFKRGACPDSILQRALSCDSTAEAIETQPMDVEERNEIMLEAHEKLAGLSESNRLQFEDVLTFLRKSQQKKRANDDLIQACE